MSLRNELLDDFKEAHRLGMTYNDYTSKVKKLIKDEDILASFVDHKENSLEGSLRVFRECIKKITRVLLKGNTAESSHVEGAIQALAELAYNTCVLSKKNRKDFCNMICDEIKNKFI